MDELIEEFLVETKEGLEELGNDLVVLEKDSHNKDIIGKIFRCMHTIKGTCGFLGLSKLESIAHAGEDIFDLIRNDKLETNPNIVSTLFETLDKISHIVDYIEENETEPDEDYTGFIQKLRSLASGTVESETSVEEAASITAEEVAAQADVQEEREHKVEAVSQIGDSDELQALFDSTESLVDLGNSGAEENATEVTQALPEAENKPSEIGDSDELQALFDATETLVEMGENKETVVADEIAEEKTTEPVKTEAKAEETDKKSSAKKPSSTQTIRVNLDVLEDLMQHASELVLTRNQLMQLLRKNKDSEFSSALQRLNNITTGLQEGVMQTRMQPVGNAWTKLPRIIRDLANELNKKIDLKMSGEDTELDRQLLELITDPLTHMVRNSADHGLESPEERIAAGKPEVGTIELKAYHGGGYIIIEISDDGGGIDPEKIKQKAISSGLTTEHEAADMSKEQILQFIFAAGFSTAEQVTSVSGRGVGMDVVRNNIEKIRGAIDLKSEIGEGSVFTIKIPLTLAIMSILQVGVKGQKFAIPQINVIEIVKANSSSGFVIEKISDRPVLRLRDDLLPLVSLCEALGMGECDLSGETQSNFVVVCEIGNYRYGVIVDQILDTEEIVMKPVSPVLKSIEVYSGSTILGDGSVILILDPNGLAKTAGEIPASNQNGGSDKKSLDDNGEMASFIVFKAGDATPKVAPLEIISRLEEINVNDIEYSRGQPVIQYRGDLMKIIYLDENYKIPEDEKMELLVLANGDKIMGLAVDEIIDLAKCPIQKDFGGGKDGFLGSIVINNKTCDVVDIGYYFKKVFGEGSDESSNIPQHDPSKKTVMMVDDSPFFRKFIPPEIKKAGYNVVAFPGAREALEALKNGDKFDIIVSDLHMPEMDGSEFLQICRKDERFKDIPFIALSSHTEGKEGINQKNDGDFDAFVSKTNHEELAGVLAKFASKEAVA